MKIQYYYFVKMQSTSREESSQNSGFVDDALSKGIEAINLDQKEENSLWEIQSKKRNSDDIMKKTNEENSHKLMNK